MFQTGSAKLQTNQITCTRRATLNIRHNAYVLSVFFVLLAVIGGSDQSPMLKQLSSPFEPRFRPDRTAVGGPSVARSRS